MMIRFTNALGASLLCLVLAGCEFGSGGSAKDEIRQGAAADHGERRGNLEAAADDPIARAREAQEAAAAKEVAEAQAVEAAQLQAQNDARDAPN
jgi:hypothetical protein